MNLEQQLLDPTFQASCSALPLSAKSEQVTPPLLFSTMPEQPYSMHACRPPAGSPSSTACNATRRCTVLRLSWPGCTSPTHSGCTARKAPRRMRCPCSSGKLPATAMLIADWPLGVFHCLRATWSAMRQRARMQTENQMEDLSLEGVAR